MLISALKRSPWHYARRMQRWSSSSTPAAGQQPLFLWLGGEDNDTVTTAPRRRLLLPVTPPTNPTWITNPTQVQELVNQHYESDAHFVGGMGESDPGVWFATTATTASTDVLDHAADILQPGIAAVKEERHGVPFGVYTTGIVSVHDIPWNEIGLSCMQVSLFAGSPDRYKAATGLDAAQFGQVCGFIADAAEQGIAVEVGVLSSDVGPASDLARSLGAQQVHVYGEENIA